MTIRRDRDVPDRSPPWQRVRRHRARGGQVEVHQLARSVFICSLTNPEPYMRFRGHDDGESTERSTMIKDVDHGTPKEFDLDYGAGPGHRAFLTKGYEETSMRDLEEGLGVWR